MKNLIELKNLDLQYELIHDRTTTLKEWVINKLNRKTYVERKNEYFNALSDMNLTIKEGERLGVVGHNGAGKSTLLKVVSGILKPSHGEIQVRGAIQPLIEIGAGFEMEFSGRENIFLNSYMMGFTKPQVMAHLQEIIDFSELSDYIDTPVKYYSSGMVVRLAFTIATQIEPDILLIDEMLGAGDLAFVEKAKQRVKSLIDSARCIVVVSHDLSLVESLCNRVIMMEKGRIVEDGNPTEVIATYRKRMLG